MSRIIKAAELKVLVTEPGDTVIPAVFEGNSLGTDGKGNTILNGSNVIGDAKRQAESIIVQAQEEAELCLQRAEKELETLRLKIKEEGYAQGYEEGFQDGAEKARQDADYLLGLLEKTVEEGVRLRTSSLAALEDDVLKLSLLLADKIVRKTVEDDISWLEPIIKEALQSLGTIDEVTVYVSPLDFSLLKELEDSIQVSKRTKVSFEPDPNLNQGGCLIESENGLIDARLERRLGRLGWRLMEVLYDEKK